VKDDSTVWIVSRSCVGVVTVSDGGDELGEQAPDEVLVEVDAIFLSLFQALLEVAAFAELLWRLVSCLK
jgi:hypothetical protein